MKKLLAFILCVTLLGVFAMPASAAAKDLTYTKDATLSASFVKYGNITVRSGATVTITAGSGFEIVGNITVEPGGRLICSGVGKGDFNFTMTNKNADIIGMDLYYPYRDDAGNVTIRKVPGGFRAIAALECWNFNDAWCPAFKWNSTVNGWCLTVTQSGNPFGEIFYHNERDMDYAEQCANWLYQDGLFKGTGTDANGKPIFDLARQGSRVEALVMLIRLLGAEEDALGGDWTHPFTDVPAWADKYVGYAYQNGLTTGSSATLFGTGRASAQMYLTFLLRALEYTDDDVDGTVWQNALPLAKELGLCGGESERDPAPLCEDDFWRADMVVAASRALDCKLKDGRDLRQKLNDQRRDREQAKEAAENAENAEKPADAPWEISPGDPLAPEGFTKP